MTADLLIGNGLFGPLLRVVAVVIIALVLMTLFGAYGDIANTLHAEKSHASQTWNANTIKGYFDDGGCRPNIDICDGMEYHYCTLDDGVSVIGLVIAAADEGMGYIAEVVTGYQGSEAHWSGKCQ